MIAAADWLLQNKDRYDIRVANFSLHSSRPSSFRTDPLDRAVERLWFAGVVVVTSAGNYARDGAASGVPFAPANDPFVLTVGAADLGERVGAEDDSNAPWSAHGRTPDGFHKPDISAPGRRLVGPVPAAASLLLERPTALSPRLRCACPARRLQRRSSRQLLPSSSQPTRVDAGRSQRRAHDLGGEGRQRRRRFARSRRARRVGRPAPLEGAKPESRPESIPHHRPRRQRVPVFDAASWDSAAKADASWDSASWADVAWTDASSADASWADASWADAAWVD